LADHFELSLKFYKILIISALVLAFQSNAFSIASDCTKTCIDLTVENGALVITGKRTPVKPKYTPRPIPKPVVSPTRMPTPKPTLSKSPARKPIQRVKSKPRITPVRKKVVRKSLNDQIRQLLPTASIFQQPQSGILIREPVIFWTDSPQSFKKSLLLLDVKIDLDLRAKYLWSWGDGATFETDLIGAPFPSFEITHTYLNSGVKTVGLMINWSGRYRLDGGVWLQIPGVITTNQSNQIQIMKARTVFTG
jgi:hypothetical protein